MIVDRRWTQTDITELRNRLEVGGSVVDIAEALRRSSETVLAMMSRLHLSVRA